MVRKNVAEILSHHVTFELEAIDRMYLNADVPSLQTGGGVVYFLKTQLGVRVPSTVMVAPLSERFVQGIERFVKTQGVDLVTFEKGQRKDDVAQQYRAMFTGAEGVLFVGKAQEKTEELESWQENGETWRRLKVTFPERIATHSAEQTFYFDQQGLLKRHDYEVDVAGGAPAAHYVSALTDVSGIIVPTTHTDLSAPAGWEFSAHAAGGVDRHQRNRIQLGLMTRLETAPTEFIEAAGITFAYRTLGTPNGTPLVLLQHFTGHMDSWDPAVVNALAKDRPVVVFDNTGVSQSSGSTPDNVAQMAEDAGRFISALGVPGVDLLGFSLGGFVAEQLATTHPGRVRRMVLAGTAPQGGEEHLLAVIDAARSHTEAPDIRLSLFFTPSPASQAAGRAFLTRASARTAGRDRESGESVTGPQATALISWCATKDPEHSILRRIEQPVLVVCGSHDTMLPDQNAYFMFKHLKNAQLVLYRDSGHGALFQYPELFVNHVSLFLADAA